MTIREIVDGQAGLPCPESTKSYWHQDPSEKLLGFRSTKDLPATADIAIIGSGITGAFAAHFLKNGPASGKSVIMLEAREVCWGATGRNGGHCQPQIYCSHPPTAAFELANFTFLQAFLSSRPTLATACDWRPLPGGGVHAFFSPDLFPLAAAIAAALQRTHPDLAAQLTLIPPHDRPALAALRVPSAAGAVVQARAASLWPYHLVAGLLAELTEAWDAGGFNLQTNTPVTGIAPSPPGSSRAEAGYRFTLATPRGPVAVRQVLLATNGYTSRLLPAFADLLVPVRGQVAALLPPAPPRGGAPVRLRHSYVLAGTLSPGEGDRDEYLVQRPGPGGEFVFGGGRQVAVGKGVGEWRDDVVEGRVAAYLRRGLERGLDVDPREGEGEAGEKGEGAVADGGELEATFEWTGIMGFSRDGCPWVGPVPESAGGREGLFVCAGYTGHGMPAAALCARAVAGMMTGEGGEKGEEREWKMGDMPPSYVVTEERIERARRGFHEVSVAEELTFAFELKQVLVGLLPSNRG